MNKLICIFSLIFSVFTFGQKNTTTSEEVKQSLILKNNLEKTSLVKNIPLKNIGPSVMSGRVVDVDVNTENPSEFYVAYASGGLWYTINNGASFTPIMDNSNTQNIGDIAVDWKTGVIWVGTGENNSSRSSYAGIGILKSLDKGKTWANMGLNDTHHIGKIVLNPNNPNEVIIGATGHLYTPNEERGIYKTIDGGKTWKKTLFINENTGIIDVAHAPKNFNIIYASAWQKDRKAWNFKGNGNGSGIYKSSDAGETWQKITTPQSGFPTGEGVGRIGLAAFNENTIYAVHDNQFRRDSSKKESKEKKGIQKDDFKSMTIADFLKIDDKKLNAFLKTNNFQEKYRAENVKQLVRSGVAKPADVAKYLETANSLLFDTPVIGAEVYLSTDGGKTWKKRNKDFIDDLYYSYGYYFGEIRIDPNNQNKIYLTGVPLIASENGGETYFAINGKNMHADHQALWINPNKSGHILNGNDGGLNLTYDDGKNWTKLNTVSVGQFYSINVDNQEPYHVYGGLQDNGVWTGPHNAPMDTRWHQTGEYPWKSIMGGDGMQVQIDNRNCNIVYTGYQFGNYYRIDRNAKKKTYIQPKHELGETPYRFNWQTPILLSPHNQDIIYLGSNKLHRSLNKGDNWETISKDLTKGGKKGNVAYGTLTTISESPFKFGLLYTGSDDGFIQYTNDGGGSWSNISSTLPQNLWVSRIAASKHKKERVYVTLNGYRNDDFTPYVYLSDDYGVTWKNIAKDLPLGAVNIILEDTENENLLFLGTDNGLYVSLNKGASWQIMQNGMPNVAVHDLVIQPEAKHLLIGTHGRSIYKTDIAQLQLYSDTIKREALTIFQIDTIKHSKNWGNSWSLWGEATTPGMDITFYSSKKETYNTKVLSADDVVVNETEINADIGYNILSFDLTFSKAGKSKYLKKNKKELKKAKNGKTYLPKGKYKLILESKKEKQEVIFEIE
ncbi:glycosyl hydrolase [uncultured Maribacter sp.]|uniref:VPS10 domain-containing protein n=1 Tax=uncultured Maribacter sp. TaxID=431308 RepID=UPI0026111838|nr:glycosyl hydrolase [uncultured Maribacter sp.]